MTVKIKICGITNVADAVDAVKEGADALGFIFYENSKRYINSIDVKKIIDKLPPFVTTVGVFVNESIETVNSIVKETGINMVQLHGEEGPSYCEAIEADIIKVIRVKDQKDIENLNEYNVKAFLLDTFKEGVQGGTGETFDWKIAHKARKYGNIILSGGLTSENIEDAIRATNPYAVDVSSGVELAAGKKDKEKIIAFIKKVKSI